MRATGCGSRTAIHSRAPMKKVHRAKRNTVAFFSGMNPANNRSWTAVSTHGMVPPNQAEKRDCKDERIFDDRQSGISRVGRVEQEFSGLPIGGLCKKFC